MRLKNWMNKLPQITIDFLHLNHFMFSLYTSYVYIQLVQIIPRCKSCLQNSLTPTLLFAWIRFHVWFQIWSLIYYAYYPNHEDKNQIGNRSKSKCNVRNFIKFQSDIQKKPHVGNDYQLNELAATLMTYLLWLSTIIIKNEYGYHRSFDYLIRTQSFVRVYHTALC